MLQDTSELDVQTPLLGHVRTSWLSEKPRQIGERVSGADSDINSSIPNWAWSRRDPNGRQFPQSIAHRGYKAKHPENTMEAFKGAVKVGAHALETDIHLSKDDIVVLSHDADLKRCFGEKSKIVEWDWHRLSSLRTLRPPHEPMPRLKDLLEYVSQPGLEDIWVLLDIKLDNDSEKVMRLIAETINSVPPNPKRPWQDRLVLGIWAAKFVPLCQKYAPGFPISHIGFSTCYAQQFLKVPGVSFNILQRVLVGPIGARFIRDVKKAGRPLFAWTVNDENLMKWCIQKQLDGVITDDPKLFNDVVRNWNDNEPVAHLNLYQTLYTLWLYCLIMVFILPFRRKFPERVEQYIKTKEMRANASLKFGA